MLTKFNTLVRLLAVLVLTTALSRVGMSLAGLHPVLPYPFLLSLVFVIPRAWLFTDVVAIGGARFAHAPALGVVFGLGYLAIDATGLLNFALPEVVLLSAFLAAVITKRTVAATAGGVLGIAIMVFGNVTVWASHYLALAFARGRMADGSVRALDAAIYAALLRHPIDYHGWFPLVHAGWWFRILQSAYFFFFTELALLVFLLARDRHRLTVFLMRVFVCYGVGIATFLVWPIAGPYLAFPDSMSDALTNSPIGMLMIGGQVEYTAILSGGQPISGFGNFVGLPSLHAAMAVVFQWSARDDRVAWWALLPINLLLLASTIVLGFHYVVDVVAGLALGLAAVAWMPVPVPDMSEASGTLKSASASQ